MNSMSLIIMSLMSSSSSSTFNRIRLTSVVFTTTTVGVGGFFWLSILFFLHFPKSICRQKYTVFLLFDSKIGRQQARVSLCVCVCMCTCYFKFKFIQFFFLHHQLLVVMLDGCSVQAKKKHLFFSFDNLPFFFCLINELTITAKKKLCRCTRTPGITHHQYNPCNSHHHHHHRSLVFFIIIILGSANLLLLLLLLVLANFFFVVPDAPLFIHIDQHLALSFFYLFIYSSTYDDDYDDMATIIRVLIFFLDQSWQGGW